MTASSPRPIVIDVSGHGLGHLGQMTPVIHALQARHPAARIIVRSTHAASIARDFGPGVELDRPPPEAALVMRGPAVVDVAASASAYRALHAEWDVHLAREAERLAALQPAVLVADVPYLSLAAAERAGIPSVALCSLNWLDMYSRRHLHRAIPKRPRSSRASRIFSMAIFPSSQTFTAPSARHRWGNRRR